jgi:HEAT repeat protein
VAALSALAVFSGAGIDRIVWEASGDEDPAVQVVALTQLNAREIPNATARIMQFIESPHAEVRDTIQKLLPDFRFNRFLQTFDQLDDERRRRMFNVVRQLDKQTPIELSKMLSNDDSLLRTKALLCIDYCRDIVPLVEDALCDVLIRDEVSQLRCKAAEQLVGGQQDESRSALVQAFHRDENADVRTAAKNSLENRPTYWH